MSTQIAVKLPDEVVLAVDRMVDGGTFGSRSQAVRAALESLLQQSESARVRQAFARGFQRHPERPDEMSDARRLAIDAIEDEPWDRWW